MSRGETGPVTLFYDGGCGFCKRALRRILRFDRGGLVRTVPIQSAEADELLPGMSEKERMASWHLVDQNGVVRSAGDAVGPLLRRLRGGAPLAAVFETFPRTTDRIYRLVARNRARLGRLM